MNKILPWFKLIPIIVLGVLVTSNLRVLYRGFTTGRDNISAMLTARYIEQISQALADEYAASGFLPETPDELERFIRLKVSLDLPFFMTDPAKDIWGRRYRLERTGNGFLLQSPGRDGRFDPADDERPDDVSLLTPYPARATGDDLNPPCSQ